MERHPIVSKESPAYGKPQQQGKPRHHLTVLRVLRHRAMLRLWLAQVIYLSVQSTASYAMIVLMTDETHSATLVSLVLIALILPPFLLGAPAGALVDRMDRRKILWVSNALRALATGLFFAVLLFLPHQYYFIYVLALIFAMVGLFFAPAEGAIIPNLVEQEELLAALSLYNLTLNVCQVIGLLVIGPLALNLLAPILIPLGHVHKLVIQPVETLFGGVTLLYLIAAGLIYSLPRKELAGSLSVTLLPAEQHGLADALVPGQAHSGNERPIPRWQQMQADLRDGWRLVRRDGLLLDSLLQACFGSLIMMVIAGLATVFVQRLLHLPTSDTALVFTPAGLGLVVGSLLVPRVVAILGQSRTIIVGMIGLAAGIGLLPATQQLARILEPTGWWQLPWFLPVIAVLTILVGLGLDSVIVPSQARMQERSPKAMRGRVLAFYQTLFNGGSIPVLLFMGIMTDLLGIVTVLYLLAGLCLAVAGATLWRVIAKKRQPR